MPNVRAKGQTLILVNMRNDFVNEIDAAYPKMGYSTRAEMIRWSVYERLEREGIKLPREIATAPGRTKTRFPAHQPVNIQLNEVAAEIVAKGVRIVKRKKGTKA